VSHEVLTEVQAKEDAVVTARETVVREDKQRKLDAEEPTKFELSHGQRDTQGQEIWFHTETNLKAYAQGGYPLPKLRLNYHGNNKADPDPITLVQPFPKMAVQCAAVKIRASRSPSSQQPDASAQPAESRQPVAHQQPTGDQQPAESQQPVAHQQPTGDQQPAESQQPVTHQQPTGDQQPAESQQPVANQQPAESVRRIIGARGGDANSGGSAKSYHVLWHSSHISTWEPAINIDAAGFIFDWAMNKQHEIKERQWLAFAHEEAKKQHARQLKCQSKILDERVGDGEKATTEFLIETVIGTTKAHEWLPQWRIKTGLLKYWDSLTQFEQKSRKTQGVNAAQLETLGLGDAVARCNPIKQVSKKSLQVEPAKNQPVRASKRGQAMAESYEVGDHVLAFWSQQSCRDLSRGPQYTGAIKAINPDGSYDVAFFDNLGSVDCSVPANHIVPAPVGSVCDKGGTPKPKRPRIKTPQTKERPH
jgi:hypothetical protein